MTYLTGDIHGAPSGIVRFSKRMNLIKDDIIIILGDVGLNYYQNDRDEETKKTIEHAKATIFCVHGNHEIRPANISSYKTKKWNGGEVWFEENHPNILFAKDGNIYTINSIRYLVIGGAYSVDKFWRLRQGYGWWKDEQPSKEIKAYVEAQIKSNQVDVVLSHTFYP